MTDFLTVEDINTIDINTFVNEYFVIDTSLISTDEFSEVQYDFIKVSHTISKGEHKFIFEVSNSLWKGQYYALDSDGSIIKNTDVRDTKRQLTVYAGASDKVVVGLYLSEIGKWNIGGERVNIIPLFDENKGLYIIYKNEVGKIVSIEKQNVGTGEKSTQSVEIKEGVQDVSSNFFIYGLIKKRKLLYHNIVSVKAGIVNHVNLMVDSGFLPDGDYVEGDELDAVVLYDGQELPVVYDSNVEDYCFDLDLTDKLDTNSVKLTLVVRTTKYIDGGSYELVVPCQYVSVDNETDLMSQILSGIRVLEVGADISLTSNISISNDLIIKGNGKRLTLNNHSIIINEGNKVIIENAELNIGNPAIIQKENTNLELTGVKFTNNNATDYNNLGSCIYCDVDLESLSVDSDFTTTIKDSTFINNHSAIFHGGQLTVDNCKYLNNDLTYVDKDNPAFLYQTDGDAEITNSIFDIDYQDNTLCDEQINIGFAQALIRCGLTATINTATHESLQADNELPFFENYRNQSHVFAKYYYPQIETCVFTSPVENKETESICYCVSGTDWVYKTNAVVTRADWQNENTINNIDWEGI